MARTREQEAALRAARQMQDDIYQGLGAQRLYGPGGEGGVERPAGDPRADARMLAGDLARGGTQPLRDELDRDRERGMGRSSMPAKGMKPKAKGY